MLITARCIAHTGVTAKCKVIMIDRALPGWNSWSSGATAGDLPRTIYHGLHGNLDSSVPGCTSSTQASMFADDPACISDSGISTDNRVKSVLYSQMLIVAFSGSRVSRFRHWHWAVVAGRKVAVVHGSVHRSSATRGDEQSRGSVVPIGTAYDGRDGVQARRSWCMSPSCPRN